ncbi:aspartic peptidase domain-containing protein [Thamnidium elegans]|nr:aspartic peptidase domain-containing protein [Thamnidium elegans]
MRSNYLLFTITLLLSTSITLSYVIPNNDFISLPLIKRPPSLSLKKRATPENYKLYNADKIEYLTKIYIGTPPQEFLVSIDTGSADTWVPSTKCPKSECPYEKFEQDKSSTFKALNLSFSVTYGQGSIHGKYAKDTINLLGPGSGLTSNEQTFGLTESARDIISEDMEMTSNGILGLAFPALTANSDTMEAYNPFIFELAVKKIISQAIFSVSLNDANGWQSELTIGGVNRDKYIGEIHYVPVEKNINPKTSKLDYTFWSVKLKGIQANKNNTIPVNKNVILDTGTTYSYLSKGLADQIVQDVTQQKVSVDLQSQLYIVDCKLKSSNQTIELEFDQNTKLSIAVADLVLPPADQDSNECGFSITYNFNQEQTLVLGDNILRSALFVFDMESKRVGMATAVNSSSKIL